MVYEIYIFIKNNFLLHKMPQFHLISWSVNFVEKHSFRIVSEKSSDTMRKLCLSAEFTHQEIRWNNSFLRSS